MIWGQMLESASKAAFMERRHEHVPQSSSQSMFWGFSSRGFSSILRGTECHKPSRLPFFFSGEEVAGVYSFPCFTKEFVSCFNEEI